MHNIKYNILAGIQVLIGLINTMLIAYTLGVTSNADAYLLVMSITQAASLLTVLLVEQIVVFYSEAMEKCKGSAPLLAGNAIVVSVIAGGIFATSMSIFPCIWIIAFASMAKPEISSLTLVLLPITAVAVLGQALCNVFNGILNVHKIYGLPYAISMIPSITTSIGLLLLTGYSEKSPLMLAYAFSIGVSIQVLSLVYLLVQNRVTIGWRGIHAETPRFIRNSLSMRFAHNMHQFFSILIINTFLSGSGQGAISLFQYARRAVSAVMMIATGPISNIYLAEVAKLISAKHGREIAKKIRGYHRAVIPLFLIGSVAVVFLLPQIIEIVMRQGLMEGDMAILKSLCVALLAWNLIIVIETPYVIVTVVSKRSMTLLAINSLFLFIFFISSSLFTAKIGALGLPMSGLLAQVFSVVIFAKIARRTLTKFDERKSSDEKHS
jgi:peptidoglycan biosynthesis protein MviN/MurJ (putative lipid II flippase)